MVFSISATGSKHKTKIFYQNLWAVTQITELQKWCHCQRVTTNELTTIIINYYLIFIVLIPQSSKQKHNTKVLIHYYISYCIDIDNRQFNMKPVVAADEMFPEGTSAIMDLDDETGSNVIFEMSDKNLQADFYNDFNDLNDDDDF